MGNIYELFRATRGALRIDPGSDTGRFHSFPVADFVIGDEDLAIVAQGVLGLQERHELQLAFDGGSQGPWVLQLPDEVTARLAAIQDAALTNAAAWLLETEESDLAPAARSSHATRPSRVDGWEQLLRQLRPFAQEALAHRESVFLLVTL